ncbi:hypothetical protein Moror_12666 [Moniliophthora roreri MCA 2997]|uniref:Aminoglycoside phosphotransferase domain-containing protein n=1 Tax=Moniliophthora roreri (strain MCA 2997) TaxID=1381753 RepID=V2XPB8_MONRO|nr:hypothetical protein Moror_12666 [Moniliophthora roreri MCA 2997]
MEERPGQSLDNVIDSISHAQLDHVADQLSDMLNRMSKITSSWLGIADGSPYRNMFFPYYLQPERPFKNVEDFINAFCQIFRIHLTEPYIESILADLPRDAPITFTHADLLPKNIIVDGTMITGIIDWGTGGFYPFYREHSPPPTSTPETLSTGVKKVYVQAQGWALDSFGERHVLIDWSNGQLANDGLKTSVTQVVQLTGGPGSYHYFAPVCKIRNIQSLESDNTRWCIGDFSRAQRDRLLQLAAKINFLKTSIVNDCQVWLRELLEAMKDEGLLDEGLFEQIDKAVHLKGVSRSSEVVIVWHSGL